MKECDRCAELRIKFRIQHPNELRQAAHVAQANIEAGIIKEIPTTQRFSELVTALTADGPWPGDYLDYRFACVTCGQKFQLTAETYHGIGGSWKAIEGNFPHLFNNL